MLIFNFGVVDSSEASTLGSLWEWVLSGFLSGEKKAYIDPRFQ